MNASKKKFTKSPLGPNPLKSGKKAVFETNSNIAVLSRYSDSMVLAVILIAIIYWVLDSILNIFPARQHHQLLCANHALDWGFSPVAPASGINPAISPETERTGLNKSHINRTLITG